MNHIKLFEKFIYDSNKDGIKYVFEQNPELFDIGTPEEYEKYLKTVFPDSRIKDIVYRGSMDPKKIESSDLDPEMGTGAKNLGKGIYFAKDKEKADRYSGSRGQGRTTAFVVDVKNFFITSIQKNWDRGYFTPTNKTVREVTNNTSDTIISFQYIARDDYKDFNLYTGHYVGSLDDRGFPGMNEFMQTPYWDQMAVQSNNQVLALGSMEDQEKFKRYINNQ